MTQWHLDPEAIRRYAQGAAPPELAASAEAHLMKCADCRGAISSYVDTRRAEAIWHAVVDRVDAPRRSWPERMLVRLGVGEATARLVAATPTLRAPWLLAVAGVLALAALAAQVDERFLAMFLVVAPLGPLAGVAVAFAGNLDPTWEIGLAAPYSRLRLLLVRTAAVLAVTVPIVAAAGLALPGSHWLAVAWLLPTAGLTCAALALTGRMTPVVAVGVVATAWVLVTAPTSIAGRLDLAFGVGAQVFWLALAIGGGVWLVATRNIVTIKLGEKRMTTVRVQGASKSFGRTTALDSVDLEAGPGVTGLLGPNGAGKTTLLRIIATVLAPDRGSVTLLGRDPARPDDRTRIRERLGYLPQDAGFHRGFTVFEFVDYVAILKELTDRRARHDEVRRVITQTGLESVSAKRIRALSGGMRRRVGLAQALLGEPELLVLDEPTVGLDPEQRLRFREMISQAGEGRTVVLSSHQTEDITALCTRIAVIHQGRARFTGSPAELTAKAAGRVWTDTQRSPAAIAAWGTGDGTYRNVGDPPAGADLIPPTLEDAYLLLMGEPELEVTHS